MKIELTDEEQKVVDMCNKLLEEAGLSDLKVGCPIPPRKPHVE